MTISRSMRWAYFHPLRRHPPKLDLLPTRTSVCAWQRCRLRLGVFAEATVNLQDVPASSLGRLMSAISDQAISGQAAPGPRLVPATDSSTDTVRANRKKSSAWQILPWTGWALAAGLACAIALAFYPRQSELKNQVSVLQSQVQSQAAQTAQANAQKESLAHAADVQTQNALTATAKLSESEQRAADLRDQANRAIAKANTAVSQTGALASTVDQTAQERDALARSLQAQTERNAELASSAADAQLILNALKKTPPRSACPCRFPNRRRAPPDAAPTLRTVERSSSSEMICPG